MVELRTRAARVALLVAASLAFPSAALAQDHSAHAGHDMPMPAPSPTPAPHDDSMPGMAMDDAPQDLPPQAPMIMGGPDRSEGGSGTSRIPARDGGMHGLHLMQGDWMLMAH